LRGDLSAALRVDFVGLAVTALLSLATNRQ